MMARLRCGALATCAALVAVRTTREAEGFVASRRRASSVKASAIACACRADHSAYQAKIFDEKSDFFASAVATPPEVVPRLLRIADSCRLAPGTTVLDIGTGTGALLPFFEAAGASLEDLTGVDLSSGMLTYARQRFPKATFVHQDVAEFFGPGGCRYERVVFNACFGNLFDPLAVLQHVSRDLLADGGLVVISHPLGRKWLRGLQRKDPQMVLHDLPGQAEIDHILQQVPELALEQLNDESDYYCLVLRRRG
mmetsp:Transcript_53896/g.100994  ORF Transcript_53896/g.100994 Transcript_53896/m.100994 type:complete len:253 (+) Transcript_53896:41-799(+)